MVQFQLILLYLIFRFRSPSKQFKVDPGSLSNSFLFNDRTTHRGGGAEGSGVVGDGVMVEKSGGTEGVNEDDNTSKTDGPLQNSGKFFSICKMK